MYFLLVFQFVQIAGHTLLGLLCLDLTDIKLKFFAFKNITITASALARSRGYTSWQQKEKGDYSQTSLIRTPKGQNEEVSALQRCPYYRGRECMIFGISGTKRIQCIVAGIFQTTRTKRDKRKFLTIESSSGKLVLNLLGELGSCFASIHFALAVI